MDANHTFGSESFRAVTRGLVALHRLIKEGKDESLEADVIRDSMDAPLRVLNKSEKERAQWLSEDLYSVREPLDPSALKTMNPQAQEQLNEAFEARQQREWDRALALLRRWREYIAPALLCYVRGTIWLEACIPEVASAFYGSAHEMDPKNANYHAVYLQALAKCDLQAAEKLAKSVLDSDSSHAPIVVAHAASILRSNERANVSVFESANRCRDLVSILERNLTRIENDEGTANRVSAYTLTMGLIGICHQLLGNLGDAVRSYTQALQSNPNNLGLLIARGILQYGSSPNAVSDLERAVSLGSPLIWPYLFLAHHYLATGRFEPCRAICEMGIRLRGSAAAKSQLEEWRAIAQAELGFPADLVRAAFESSLRLDPSNELAARNRDVYEDSRRMALSSRRSAWEQKSNAAVRQFGLAEHHFVPAA